MNIIRHAERDSVLPRELQLEVANRDPQTVGGMHPSQSSHTDWEECRVAYIVCSSEKARPNTHHSPGPSKSLSSRAARQGCRETNEFLYKL